MAVLLGLLAAFSYGASDFAAGIGGRRFHPGFVAFVVHLLALATAIAALLIWPAAALPSGHDVAWGASVGLGSAGGTLMLYRGLAIGQMGVVAPLSAVMAAAIPVVVGVVGLGDRLSLMAIGGLVIALPAIGLVARQSGTVSAGSMRRGVPEALLSGAGFALLFVGLNQASAHAGIWPLATGLAVACLLLSPFALRWRCGQAGARHGTLILMLAGIFGGLANLCFLAATGHGQLSIVAVLTATYPAITILLARLFLKERWGTEQTAGLAASLVAVVLIALG